MEINELNFKYDMETNNLIEREIDLVHEEINSGDILQLLDRSEISDYFYSEVETLLKNSLSLKEAILISRKRFGDTFKIKKELLNISPVKKIIFYISIIVLLLLYIKQAIIVFILQAFEIPFISDTSISESIPNYYKYTKLIYFSLFILFAFSTIRCFLLFLKKKKSIIRQVTISFVLFELAYFLLSNILLISSPSSTNGIPHLFYFVRLTETSITAFISTALFLLIFRYLNNYMELSTR